MALGATVYNFDIDLADSDRGVYETLALRVARHPSASDEYLVARVLAYCGEYTEGIAFSSGGLSAPDDPPIAVRDVRGARKAGTAAGTPAGARLHRAAKLADRVAVYVHKEPAQWVRSVAGARILRAEAMEIWVLDRLFMAARAGGLERRVVFVLSIA